MPTVVELKKKCKELKLKKYSTLKKAELEKLLRQNGYDIPSKEKKPRKVLPVPKKSEKVKKNTKEEKKEKTTKKSVNLFYRESFQKPWIKSRKVENSLIVAELDPHVYLYRGNRKKIKLENIATYFAAWYGTCNHYMGNKKGYLNVYQLKNKNLKLLDISDVRTINTLLRNTFADKEKYEMIRKIFIASYITASYKFNGPNFNKKHYFTQFETKTQPWQLKVPLRNSAKSSDFVFANYLCEIGFDGYVAEKIQGFHSEVMLCSPEKDVQLLKEIHRTKFKNISKMKEEIQPYFN